MRPPNWPWDDSHDAMVAAPKSHRILSEDEHLRVLNITLAPNQKEPMHTHAWPSVMFIYSSATIRYTHENGETEEYLEKYATHNTPIIEELGPEGLHAVENLDSAKGYHAIRIEFKQL